MAYEAGSIWFHVDLTDAAKNAQQILNDIFPLVGKIHLDVIIVAGLGWFGQ